MRVAGHADGVSAVSISVPCGQKCLLEDSLRLLKGPPPLSFFSSSFCSFLFPSAFNWKCIYCRARGWTEEREALQLMKMWLRWGPQGLAPLQHQQLTHTVISPSFSLSLFLCVFWLLSCLLLPHVLLPSNSSLFACLFFQRLAFHFCPPVSFILCLSLSLLIGRVWCPFQMQIVPHGLIEVMCCQ